MSIKADTEFYLFMDMRAEHQWASFNMTPKKWVIATQAYNSRLEALNKTEHRATITKNPRALMDMLGEVESKVANRLLKNDFVCKLKSHLAHHDLNHTDPHSLAYSCEEQDRSFLEEALQRSTMSQSSGKCNRQ